jgi:hypothetical protein
MLDDGGKGMGVASRRGDGKRKGERIEGKGVDRERERKQLRVRREPGRCRWQVLAL